MGTKMEYNRDTINARIEEARKDYLKETGKRITHEYIAEYLGGIARPTVSNWLNKDKNDLIPFWALLKLCDLFNCDLGYLLGDHPTKRHQNETPCAVTGLSENTINLLQEATTDERKYFNKIIGECLGNRSGFYFDMLQEWNETKRLYEEAHQNPHFEMVERIRREILKAHPEHKTPVNIESAQTYIMYLSGLIPEIRTRLTSEIMASDNCTRWEAREKAEKIEVDTGYFFFEYYRHNALYNYRVIDLQNALAIYLNEDIKQWQKTKK